MSHLFVRPAVRAPTFERPMPLFSSMRGPVRRAGQIADDPSASSPPPAAASSEQAIPAGREDLVKECSNGRRFPTMQIVAVIMYGLIAVIGIALLIAYWNLWWPTNKIYALLAIFGVVLFAVLAIVTGLLPPCAPQPTDKHY